MRALVITIGSPKESFGAMKLAAWLRRIGYHVDERSQVRMFDSDYDLYCFSCVFSWRLPALIDQVLYAKLWGEVWIGGPAVTFHPANAAFVREKTGITPFVGLDDRFESEVGQYPYAYFSRGCPAYTPACGVCPVPRIEGNQFRFYPDAIPAPMLLDNNLSALPVEYQEHIIDRYADWRGKVDANSGFEPHTFDSATLARWGRFPLRFWRFGYDDLTERDQALEMMRLLKAHGYQGQKVRVYTMIGNEPIRDCHKRIREVIDHGMHPWPQRLRPLDWLGPDGTLPTRFDWDEASLIAYQRFYSYAGLWKRMKPEEFFYQSRYALQAA
jgi:hypothetical protein